MAFLLSSIRGPRCLDRFSIARLATPTAEIGDYFIVEVLAPTGTPNRIAGVIADTARRSER